MGVLILRAERYMHQAHNLKVVGLNPIPATNRGGTMFLKIKNYITKNTGLLIRLDDIAENMNWDLMKKLEILFEKYEIKPVLGVVPNNKDTEFLYLPKKDDFWNEVRKWNNKGWEIAMHGSTHVYDMVSDNKDYFSHGGKSEFCGHSLEIQMLRIKNGLKKKKNPYYKKCRHILKTFHLLKTVFLFLQSLI